MDALASCSEINSIDATFQVDAIFNPISARAKGVSAKSQEFDEMGNEVSSDFLKIMKIVKEAGYKGYIGIEYEGNQLSEDEGIKATKALLEKVFKEF